MGQGLLIEQGSMGVLRGRDGANLAYSTPSIIENVEDHVVGLLCIRNDSILERAIDAHFQICVTQIFVYFEQYPLRYLLVQYVPGSCRCGRHIAPTAPTVGTTGLSSMDASVTPLAWPSSRLRETLLTV